MNMKEIKIVDRLNDLLSLNEFPIDTAKTTPLALASLYMAYQEESKWIEQITPFIPSPLSSKASDNIKTRIKQIATAYLKATHCPFLGNELAWEKPDLIIILGTISPGVEERMEFAIPIIHRFPNIPLILSGGGQQLTSEASIMKMYLHKKKIMLKCIYKETDSLDTQGNAIFSKFLMQEHNLLDYRKILLITSDYHGPRSLHYFQCVFGPTYSIAVALSPSNFEEQDLEKLVHEEMTSLIRCDKEIFTLYRNLQEGESLCQSLEGDEISIYYQLLTQHPMYRMRWDLIRRYAHLTSINTLPVSL
jgi:uncharacterized SAM-binding protein YcdF (DUF218 family)